MDWNAAEGDGAKQAGPRVAFQITKYKVSGGFSVSSNSGARGAITATLQVYLGTHI